MVKYCFLYTLVDFAEALNLFPAHTDWCNDIQNMLLSISQQREDHQYVRKFLASNTDLNSEPDFEFINNSITKTMKNVSLSVISSITDPILNGFYRCSGLSFCFDWSFALASCSIFGRAIIPLHLTQLASFRR